MKFSNLKVSIISTADHSDPINQLMVVSARATVDGVRCGWRSVVIRGSEPSKQLECIEEAFEQLVLKILKAPKNEILINNIPARDVEIVIPDVPLAQQEVA